MVMNLTLGAVAALAISGVPGLWGKRRGSWGQGLSIFLMAAGSVSGLWAAVHLLVGRETVELAVDWLLPWGRFALKLDPLGAVFLVPVFLIPTLGAVYGQSYWKQSEHPANGRKLRFFYGLLAASMAMVVIARDGVLFLIVWEVMAVSAYFVATAEDSDPEACRAGWVYLVATHLGTICLIAMFAYWRRASGTFSIDSVAGDALDPAQATTIFLLALVGFGFKAGLMPLHVWLPGAHANAPSHVSAVMSGVMLKMGVYGIVRMASVLPAPPAWWGGLLLALGAFSGVIGVAFALGQRDLKRALAYSSIENIGIIAMGVGLALLGRSQSRPDWVALGLAGALLHVWNHSLFKSLLFMNAGAIIHATHTRQIDRLGGLAKKMPVTALLFMVGAGAISALPPLNGFVSELLIYLGLFRTTGIGAASAAGAWPMAALAAPALAMVGALAVACFVNLLGGIFLGQSRSDAAEHAHDPSKFMTLPMVVLALLCAGIGFVPGTVAPVLEGAVLSWSHAGQGATETLAEVVPFVWITRAAFALAALVAILAFLLRLNLSGKSVGSAGTWDCGYARPTAKMEYTGSSFGDFLTKLFGWALRPKVNRPHVAGIFARVTRFDSQVPDTVLDRLVLPFFKLAGRLLPWFRVFQQGRLQVYILYFVVVLVLLFLWGAKG